MNEIIIKSQLFKNQDYSSVCLSINPSIKLSCLYFGPYQFQLVFIGIISTSTNVWINSLKSMHSYCLWNWLMQFISFIWSLSFINFNVLEKSVFNNKNFTQQNWKIFMIFISICNNENNVKNKICSLIKIDFNCRHTAW